jgi:stage II sporulation protein E
MNHLLQIFPYLQNQQEEHLSKKLKLVMEVKKDQSLHSGDHYYFDEKKQYLLLSDGMGHDYNSSLVSSYTISLISLLINQNMDIVEALKYVNDIIRLKTYDEIYATLDIGYFDCKNKKLLLYKVGAFSTFLIRNHQLFEYQTRVPPLGIIDQIHVRLEEIKMEKGDIFLFITDGFGEDINTLIETTLDQVTILSFKSYLNLLYDTLNKYNSNDDKTLIGIKIVDNL